MIIRIFQYSVTPSIYPWCWRRLYMEKYRSSLVNSSSLKEV